MHQVTQSQVHPDRRATQAFLDALEPNGRYIFQTFDDSPAKRGYLVRVLTGTLAEQAAELQRLNEAGAGVFVMVNAGTARNNASVTRVRSYFVDLDGVPLEPLLEADPQPDILVESSPGKAHGYWLTGACPLDQFKSRQKALAAHFGGDPAVCDLARVMRLPGFYHRKTDTPFLVKLLRYPSAA